MKPKKPIYILDPVSRNMLINMVLGELRWCSSKHIITLADGQQAFAPATREFLEKMGIYDEFVIRPVEKVKK